MTLRPTLKGRTAEGHTVINRAVITYFSGLADHDAHPVVDQHSVSDLSCRMNLNPG